MRVKNLRLEKWISDTVPLLKSVKLYALNVDNSVIINIIYYFYLLVL